MSKPLIFVMQLIALGFIVAGTFVDPLNWTRIGIGLALAIVAGIAIRQRFRRG